LASLAQLGQLGLQLGDGGRERRTVLVDHRLELYGVPLDDKSKAVKK
jgi:hypothetical protein